MAAHHNKRQPRRDSRGRRPGRAVVQEYAGNAAHRTAGGYIRCRQSGAAVRHAWRQAVSLFAANDGFACRVSYIPGCAEWEKDIGKNKIRTRLFIPQGLDARVLLIDRADRLPLIWELEPALGGKNGACLRIEEELGLIRLSSPDSYYPGLQMLIGSSAELDAGD